MKGHVKIELKNANGKVQTVEQDNMITNGVATYLANCISMRVQPSYYIEKLLGGIYLFDDTLTEDKNNICFPYDVNLLCRGNQSNDSADPNRGTFVSSESGVIDDGWKFTWDFSSSQANGTIKSLALTHDDGAGKNVLWAKTTSSISFPTVTANKSTNSVSTLSTLSSLCPICADDTAFYYYYSVDNSVYKINYPYDGRIKGNNVCTITKIKTLGDEIKSNYGTLTNGYDGYMYMIYKSTSSVWKIKKIKISDFSFDEIEDILTIKTSDVGGSSYVFLAKCGDYVYISPRYATDGIIYKINISSGEIETTYAINNVYNMFNFTANLIYINNNDGKQHEKIFNTFTEKYNEITVDIGGGAISQLGITNNYNVQVVPYTNSPYMYIASCVNYLGTICNLETPIVKTNEQTLRITYTLKNS